MVLIRWFCFAAFLIFPSFVFSQAKVNTIHYGYWTDPTIWSTGSVPGPTDSVFINHYVVMDVNVVLTTPGILYVTKAGYVCSMNEFTGSFIHYGPLMLYKFNITDTSYSYAHFIVTLMTTVPVGAEWTIYSPGYGCIGCPFTCVDPTPPVASFTGGATICTGNPVQFFDQSSNSPTAWAWSFPGGSPSTSMIQNPVVTYDVPGTYDVLLIASNFIGSDTVIKNNLVHVIPSPTVTVSPDVSVQYGDSAIFTASGGGFYNWTTGDTVASILVYPSATTTYSVLVTSANGCTDQASVTVYLEPCPFVFLPNAFSPNNDGENDFLQLYNENQECIKEIYIQIYNGIGEKVFESSDRYFQWDGTYKSSALSSGIFAYHLQVKLYDDSIVNSKGNISLIR